MIGVNCTDIILKTDVTHLIYQRHIREWGHIAYMKRFYSQIQQVRGFLCSFTESCGKTNVATLFPIFWRFS